MSKSLGTGVDPLELISRYGADATRFGLAYMSSVQDVRFSAERIEMGRNFANKIWNAGRFALPYLSEEDLGASPEDRELELADRWILSRFRGTTLEVTEALEAFRLHDAAAAVGIRAQRSILLRNPYVDPMSLLQVDLLRRWRESDRADDELLGALLTTVHGIAEALQNTG